MNRDKLKRMKKFFKTYKILIDVVLIALVCIIIAEAYFINAKYGLNIYEYFKYSMPLTDSEEEYLAENDLVFGMDQMAPPLSFINQENGTNEGMVVDFISQLSLSIGDDINYEPMEWAVLIEDLEKGEVDIADLFRSDEREEKFLFTQSLYVLSGKILADDSIKYKDLSEIRNVKIAMVKGDYIDEVASEYFGTDKNIEMVYTADIREALELLGDGEVNGVAGDDTVISYIANDMGYDEKYDFIKEPLYTKDVCLATNKDNEILVNILNKGIISLKKRNLIAEIQNKWFRGYEPEVMDNNEYIVLMNMVIAFIIIGVISVLWNNALSNRVKERTKELNENKESLRIIIDTLHDGLILINKDNLIEECNNSITKILDMEADELIGRDYLTVEKLRPFVMHLLEDEYKNADREKLVEEKGSYFLVTKRLFSEDRSKMLVAIQDYTEKHVNEMRARQESKMIAVGQLSAGLAHEIRNPLGLIRSYMFLLDKHAEKESDKHAIMVIDDSVKRINGLIENLLSFSRLSTEERKVINLKELVNGIVQLEKKNLKGKGIQIRVDIKNNLNFKSNEEIIKMSILNLINNGIDSYENLEKNEEINEIIVKGYTEKSEVIIEISDNGSGIKDEDIENVFNPFYTTKAKGTGLGLYIISNELEKINGNITLESRVGYGTKFRITLPKEGKKENE